MSDLYFEKGKIRVTKNVFSNGKGENFVIANIRHLRDERRGKSVIPLILGAVLGIVASIRMYFPYSDLVIGTIGSLFVTQYFLSKDTFILHITTQVAEVKAFTTKKEAVFAEVMRAIRRAMVEHQKIV